MIFPGTAASARRAKRIARAGEPPLMPRIERCDNEPTRPHGRSSCAMKPEFTGQVILHPTFAPRPISHKVNAAELTTMFGCDLPISPDEAKTRALTLARRNGRPVFVTLAERGIVAAAPDGTIEHVPAVPVADRSTSSAPATLSRRTWPRPSPPAPRSGNPSSWPRSLPPWSSISSARRGRQPSPTWRPGSMVSLQPEIQPAGCEPRSFRPNHFIRQVRSAAGWNSPHPPHQSLPKEQGAERVARPPVMNLTAPPRRIG